MYCQWLKKIFIILTIRCDNFIGRKYQLGLTLLCKADVIIYQESEPDCIGDKPDVGKCQIMKSSPTRNVVSNWTEVIMITWLEKMRKDEQIEIPQEGKIGTNETY